MLKQDMSKYSIITLEEVHSTNSYALENILSFDDKTVIFSPHQSLGRGRYNRKWISDNTENLYISFILKPENISNYPFANLTQYLSVILCDLLKQEFNLNPQIKWPNDILINGYKISGILAESYMENNRIKAIVLGLGLNVNLNQETIEKIDQKATSLSVLLNKNFNVENILNKLCDKFFQKYDDFINKGFAYIKKEYIMQCNFLGSNIKVREFDKEKNYFAKSIDDEGLLVVIDENNIESKIITGDVLC